MSQRSRVRAPHGTPSFFFLHLSLLSIGLKFFLSLKCVPFVPSKLQFPIGGKEKKKKPIKRKNTRSKLDLNRRRAEGGFEPLGR